MKKILTYACALLLYALMWGCRKADFPGKYPGATISPYVAIFDIKDLYRGSDVILSRENMGGSGKITALVVSDHSGGNLPAGLLVVQERRRLSQLRGISIPIGAAAAAYMPGDSVTIDVEGGVLKKVNGILQVTGLSEANIKKLSSGNAIPVNRVPVNAILANPDIYESTLAVVVKGGFNPLPAPGAVLAGNRLLNDGFGDITLHTEPAAAFASTPAPFNANYYGIVFNNAAASEGKQPVPEFRMRTAKDVVVLSSTVEVTPVIITGFISDVKGGDGNYEYIQLMATHDINFAVTPYSVVVTNNANASAPTGAPVNGWGTGGMRTFKFNLTGGMAAKGTFFYVGGSGKTINGSESASMAGSNWIRSFNYTTTDGDGFGTKTGGLFANSGNASGLAVFEGTTVTAATKPVDVLFVSTGGSLYTPGPPERGYRIANTDFYDIRNPVTLRDQPYFTNGSNTLALAYTTADMGYFYLLGGEYNVALGRWMRARSQTNVLLTKASTVAEIEGNGSTTLK